MTAPYPPQGGCTQLTHTACPSPGASIAPTVHMVQQHAQHLASTGAPIIQILIVALLVCGFGLTAMLAGRRR